MFGIRRSVLRHLLAGAALVLAAPAFAATTSVLGVEVAFDAETGRLIRPAPAIVQQLRAALATTYAAAHEAGETVALGGGTQSIVLDERHAAFSIARIESDGRVATRCVGGAQNAEAELAAAAAAVRTEEE